MLPILRLGPLAIQTDGLILLLSYILALEAVQRKAGRLALKADAVYTLGYVAALAGLIAARAAHVVAYWDVYRGDPTAIIALTPDGLAPLPGLGAALIVALAYAQRRQLDSVRLLDALTPGLVIMAVALALAAAANGDGYGTPSALPWAVDLWGARRHPVQLYEAGLAVGVGLALARARRPFDGAHVLLFLVLYAGARLLSEGFRAESALLAGFRVVQIACLLTMVFGLLLLRQWARKIAYHAGD